MDLEQTRKTLKRWLTGVIWLTINVLVLMAAMKYGGGSPAATSHVGVSLVGLLVFEFWAWGFAAVMVYDDTGALQPGMVAPSPPAGTAGAGMTAVWGVTPDKRMVRLDARPPELDQPVLDDGFSRPLALPPSAGPSGEGIGHKPR